MPRLSLLFLALVLIGLTSACYSLPSPDGWADPVFAGNTVFYSSGRGQLAAYDTNKKTSLWKFPQEKNVKLEALYSTPVVDEQTIYFGAYNGSAYALDQKSGQQRWTVNTGSAIIGGPLLKSGIVYVANSDGHVLALQAEDGKKLWQREAGRRVWSTPVDAGDLIVVTSMDSAVYAFNPRGDLVWKSTAAAAAIAAPPSVDNARLTFGGFDKRFHAIQQSNGQAVWNSPQAGNWFWTTGLLSGPNLYAGNLDGRIYDFDSGTGELRWQVDLGSPIRSAPVLNDGVLLVASRNGMIHGLDPQSGREQWPAVNAGGSILSNLVTQADGIYALTQPGGKGGGRLLLVDAKGSPANLITP